jgi:hypothetical protein
MIYIIKIKKIKYIKTIKINFLKYKSVYIKSYYEKKRSLIISSDHIKQKKNQIFLRKKNDGCPSLSIKSIMSR